MHYVQPWVEHYNVAGMMVGSCKSIVRSSFDQIVPIWVQVVSKLVLVDYSVAYEIGRFVRFGVVSDTICAFDTTSLTR